LELSKKRSLKRGVQRVLNRGANFFFMKGGGPSMELKSLIDEFEAQLSGVNVLQNPTFSAKQNDF